MSPTTKPSTTAPAADRPAAPSPASPYILGTSTLRPNPALKGAADPREAQKIEALQKEGKQVAGDFVQAIKEVQESQAQMAKDGKGPEEMAFSRVAALKKIQEMALFLSADGTQTRKVEFLRALGEQTRNADCPNGKGPMQLVTEAGFSLSNDARNDLFRRFYPSELANQAIVDKNLVELPSNDPRKNGGMASIKQKLGEMKGVDDRLLELKAREIAYYDLTGRDLLKDFNSYHPPAPQQRHSSPPPQRHDRRQDFRFRWGR